ncbi:MAG: flagellar biosynthesis anti-sigma factor FlgM [Bacillota bacterium]
MKVGPTNGTDILKLYGIQQKQAGGKATKPEKDNRVSDSFEPSAEIQELQGVKELLQKLSEVREDLVTRLRKEIEDGTYKPDPKQIAKGIIEELRLDRRS